MDGLATAQAVKQIDPNMVCVTMTGYSTMDTAIEAIKLGVDEFILKPFSSAELSMSIAKALEKERLRKENIRLRALIPLFEFNKTILSTVEIDAILDHVLQLAEREIQADLAILFLENADKIDEYTYPSRLQDDSYTRPLRLELARWIMKHGGQLSMHRGQPYHKYFNRLLEEMDIEFLVGLPLVAKEGQSFGALILGKCSSPFAQGDSEFLQVMTSQAAIAIENARLFQEAQQAYQELEKLDQMKRKFINIAAHELRTPLAILMGYATVLADEADEEDRARFDVIIRNAMRLGNLVDNMLNLNYLETGRARLMTEEVILADALHEAILDTSDMANEKSLHIDVSIPRDFPPLLTDRQKLDLIILNLLTNAIKYTPNGGNILLKAWPDGDKALIAVCDSGIGIPPEERDRIFDAFYQVEDSLTRHYGGIGLGLALVKSLLELCQGHIWLESEVGKGSTFTFELPLQLPPP
jgi:signal transduction histidine kinase